MIPPFLDNALGYNAYRTGLLFHRELARALKEYDITPEQWTVLATLWSTGKPVNQSEIVQLTMKDKHTTSRIIQRLERDGWIQKKSDPKDGRVTLIHPTPKANSLKNKIPRKVLKHFDILLEDYSDKEIQLLINLLKRLRKTLEK